MKSHSTIYKTCLFFSIITSQIFTYDSEMTVYDIKNHKILGSYQRIGTIQGHESGIIKKTDQNTIHVIEKQTLSTPGLIGYIKYNISIRKSGHSSKRSYLYLADQSENKPDTDIPKKKHNHIMA